MSDSEKLKRAIADKALVTMRPNGGPPNEAQRSAIYSRLIVATYGKESGK